jgi:hypothetical protein
MSQLLQGIERGITDGIAAIDALGAADYVHNGIPYDDGAGTAVAIDSVGAIAFHHQGLPFTAASRLAVAISGVVDHWGGGAAPFTAAGRLAVAPAVVDHYSAGVAYNADGNLSFSDAIIFGPELLINGGFNATMVGWTEQIAIAQQQTGQLRCQGPLAYAYQEIVTEVAAVYRVTADQIHGGGEPSIAVIASASNLAVGEIASNVVTNTVRGASWLFTATGIATFILLRQSDVSPSTAFFDNVSVRKTTETP